MKVGKVFGYLTVAMLAIGSVTASATSRDQSWEWTVQALYNEAETNHGQLQSGLDVDSSIGLGFSLGYNLTSHLGLNAEFGYLRPDYKATLVSEDGDPIVIDHHMSVFNSQFNGIYNFGSGAFTPYVQAGLGFTYFDSNVSSGSPTVGCWWTWYGYVCSSYYSTYDDTSFSYNVGGGLRYEFNRSAFVRGGITRTWVDGSENVTMDIWKIEIGQVF